MKDLDLNLKRWTRPRDYAGAEWPEYYVFLGQTRDSDALARSNFRCGQALLQAIPTPTDWPHDFAPWTVVRASHWACGWVEWIAIHEGATAHLQAASEAQTDLDWYPVLNESDFSTEERQEADETWRDFYRPAERANYIRQHPDQFEFRNLREMLGCVRGKHFAGCAGELLS